VVLENFAHVVSRVLDHCKVRYVVIASIGDLLSPARGRFTNFFVRHLKKLVPPFRIAEAISFPEALRTGRALKWKDPRLDHDAVALLQYTGGTTGVSKGAILTHGNLVAVALQSYEWFKSQIGPDADTWLVTLPIYHIATFFGTLLAIRAAADGTMILDPRDLRSYLKDLRRVHPTSLSGVNTLFNALVNKPQFCRCDFSRLKLVIGGAAAIHPSVAEKWHAATSVPITQAYGLTETAGLVTCNPPGLAFNGTVGLPLPSTEVSIRDDCGQKLPIGCDGEICVRGPQVMRGYWQRPAATAEAFTPDGWLRTGDIGNLDPQGFLRITDRKKDMILVSGFNVFPSEVEAVINAMPEVAECGVVGLPNGIGGQTVKAFVQRKDPGLTPEAVIRHCHIHLTNYKVPKQVEFVESLPMTYVGKILRRELRA